MTHRVLIITSIIFMVMSCATALGQDTWLRTIGGSKDDNSGSVCSTPDGGIVAIGHTWSSDGDVGRPNMGITDMYVVKLDARGNIVWKTTVGGEDEDYSNAINLSADGGYLLAGTSASKDGDFAGMFIGGLDIPVVKLDSEGRIVWKKMLGGTKSDAATRAVSTRDGGYVLVGNTSSNDGDFLGLNKGGTDILCMKIDAEGSIVWKGTFGGTDSDNCSSITATADGGYALTGFTSSIDGDVAGMNKGGQDVIVVKIDATGKREWTATFGGSLNDAGRGITATADGNIVVAGHTSSNDGDVKDMNKGARDILVVKIDPRTPNQPLWKITIGGSADETAAAVSATEDGGVFITGSTTSNDGDFAGMHKQSSDVFVIKLDAQGTITQKKLIGGSRQDAGFMIAPSTNKGVVVVGNTASNDFDFASKAKNDLDIFVVKLDSLGAYDPPATSVDEVDTPVQPELLVVPNPVRWYSKYIYTLNAPCHVRIELIDMVGQLTQVLADGMMDAGQHRMPFNAPNLLSGMYTLRMVTPENVTTTTVLVVQ